MNKKEITQICDNNFYNCFCWKQKKHKGIHACRCGGSWDNQGIPYSLPDISLGFNAFPLTDSEKERLDEKP